MAERCGSRPVKLTPKQELGKKLFFDANLSTPPGQSCATCHSPDAGFGDPESSLPVPRAVQRDRFGGRNEWSLAGGCFGCMVQIEMSLRCL